MELAGCMSGKHVTKQSQPHRANRGLQFIPPGFVDRSLNAAVFPFQTTPASRVHAAVVTLRRRSDAVGLAVGLMVFALSAAIAVRGPAIGEARLFVAINSLADWLYYAIWPFMQFGVFVTIPILVVIALVMRRVRLAAAMAIGGVGVYFLALVAKNIVDRGRPAALLATVEGRETFVAGSLGFPSGHAAVAAALTVVVTPYLSGRWRYVPVALLAIVIVGRLYVGAHLPLDLLGGAALGVAAGSAANLIVGVPAPVESATVDEPREEPTR